MSDRLRRHLAYRTSTGLLIGLVLAAALAHTRIQAQGPAQSLVSGRNVNMVSGTTWPTGDPFLQRQNEPSVAASTRNPLHLLAGSNDYRTIDLPFPQDGDEETGDAWLGLFKSFDGGQRWQSNLIPGYPQDITPDGVASPLKGYEAAADPVVRAGTNGLFYYGGIVFDRAPKPGDPPRPQRSAIFVARLIDNNNSQGGDPIAYVGASIVASDPGTTGRFLDKPWVAVDIPRSDAPTCLIPTAPGASSTQAISAGTVYVAFSAFTGEGPTLRSEILFSQSTDCGATWSTPIRVSGRRDPVNQGASIAIDPVTGSVYVAWRRFSQGTTGEGDAIMVARSVNFGRRFSPPGEARRFPRGNKRGLSLDKAFEHRRPKTPVEVAELSAFDQGSSAFDLSFRTNAYPTMTFDDQGRLYLAWVERGFATVRPDPMDGDARIVISTSHNGASWTSPRVVEDLAEPGHQIMPTLSFAGGKLVLAFYDLREDHSQLFTKYVDDRNARDYPVVTPAKRHTFDIRAAMAPPGANPVFQPSIRVSDYLFGALNGSSAVGHLKVDPPNLPMFKGGTVPFMGDYIDVAPAPAFVPLTNGRWAYNTSGPAVFHAVWTDNRDVQAPADGDWRHYTPPNSPFTSQTCTPGFAASRNQNIYTARLTTGLLVGSPGNTRLLSTTVQHSFVVFAQNTTVDPRSFRFTILNQPPGGHASFDQFSSVPVTHVDVTTPPRSMVARTVYVTASDPHAPISVDVSEIAGPGAPVIAGGLAGSILLNPDVENPDPENPDVENTEIVTPDVENPDVENPDVENAAIATPDVENPDVENIVLANPDVENFTVGNPDVENPDVENPDVENPDVENRDVVNGTVSDVTWAITNTGNTTSAYNVNVFLNQSAVPGGIKLQLILRKVYTTPTTHDCSLKLEPHNVLVASIRDPQLLGPSSPGLPDTNDPSGNNATLWLAPGEEGKITLRVVDPDKSNNVIVDGASIDPAFVPTTQVTLIVQQQPVNTEDAQHGVTEPPVVTPSGSTLFFLQQPTSTPVGGTMAPPVRVQVRDTTGAVLPGVAVTLALSANPGGATLFGGGPVLTNATGIAVFPSIRLSASGVGYRLRASAALPGLAPVDSAPFDSLEAPILITGIVPPTAADGFGQLINIQGTALPTGAKPRAIFTQGATSVEGFVFIWDSTMIFARLPLDQQDAPLLAPGPAWVQVTDSSGDVMSNLLPLTVSTTPGTPVLRSVVATLVTPAPSPNGDPCGGGLLSTTPLTSVVSGQGGVAVSAFGTDTSGATVVFTQGDSVIEVPALCTLSPTLGIASVAAVPVLTPGVPVTVQIRTRVNNVDSALSNAVTLVVWPAPSQGQVTDPVGDALAGGNPSPDLVSATITQGNGVLTMSVRFAPGTFSASTTLAQFMLDTDENPTTGHPGVNSGCVADAGVIGSEYLVNIQSGSAVVYKYDGTCNSFTVVATLSASAVTDGYDVTVPLSLLGGDDGLLDFKLTTSAEIAPGGYTGVLDVMPDVGLPPGKTTGG